MIYGISGNTTKEKLWAPVTSLVQWLLDQQIDFRLTPEVADGLLQRRLLPESVCRAASTDKIAADADVVLSFGGDGTFLHTAHEVGSEETPILGVNIGRLGFLAETETAEVQEAIRLIERGEYDVEPRSCLEASVGGRGGGQRYFALNEILLERSGRAGLIAIDVSVDDVPLNHYWADGIIVATPTGSTAYSLSVGGPIVTPTSEVFVIAPIASHSLTVRPIVLSDRSVIRARIDTRRHAFVLAADGRGFEYGEGEVEITLRRADRVVNLLRLPGHRYFQTLRNKLMWGMRKGD